MTSSALGWKTRSALTERAQKSPKILCSGIAVQDIVMRVENFPMPGTKVAGSEFIITGGGCPPHSSAAIARLQRGAPFARPPGGGRHSHRNPPLSVLGQ